jgi:hypothetical protein
MTRSVCHLPIDPRVVALELHRRGGQDKKFRNDLWSRFTAKDNGKSARIALWEVLGIFPMIHVYRFLPGMSNERHRLTLWRKTLNAVLRTAWPAESPKKICLCGDILFADKVVTNCLCATISFTLVKQNCNKLKR